ncbi:MAG TPA: hypothetical protein VMV77_09565 [Bacteroidales bacterium]|nr:hypothetical protein [Bacteroidales bacterium]
MKRIVCILILVSVFLARNAFSQVDSTDFPYAIADTHNVNIRLFDSDELFEITLRFDITYYKRKKPEEEYLDAILTYHTSDSDSINKQIKVRSRGIVRHDICYFPPLSLNFKMKGSTGQEFTGINKLKMVTHCRSGYQDYILKEYLIYKLYNVLTDYSFKVRLLRINYINTAKESKPLREFGFFIEPLALFEKRTNSIELESIKVNQKMIKPEMMDRMAIFNYMIGNTDWSVPILHNVVVLSQPTSERPDLAIILPYDFDYSGLVNTSYAVPFEGLEIKSVRDRRYLGICRDKDVFVDALGEFSDKKEELSKVINDFPYLKEKTKKEMINYLDGFFNGIDKPNNLINKLFNGCIRF